MSKKTPKQMVEMIKKNLTLFSNEELDELASQVEFEIWDRTSDDSLFEDYSLEDKYTDDLEEDDYVEFNPRDYCDDDFIKELKDVYEKKRETDGTKH